MRRNLLGVVIGFLLVIDIILLLAVKTRMQGIAECAVGVVLILGIFMVSRR